MVLTWMFNAKLLPVEKVCAYLPANFHELPIDQQDAAYLMADWQAKNPGLSLDDLHQELCWAASILGCVLLVMLSIIGWMLWPL